MLLMAAPALAQDEGGQRPERRGRPGGGPPSIDQMLERIADRLELDDEQFARFKEIVTAAQEEQKNEQAEGRDRPGRGFAGFTIIRDALEELRPSLSEEQVGRLDEMNARFGQGGDRGRGGRGSPFQMFRELPEVLNLDEQQRKDYDELVAEHREMMMERMRQAREQGNDRPDEPADEGEAGERPRRPRFDFEAMQEEFINDLKNMLNEEQLQALAQYQEDMAAERQRGREGREATGVQRLFDAAKRIRGLERDQMGELRDLERESLRAEREVPREDREGRAMFSEQVKEQILRILTPEQTEAFEQNLQRGGRDRMRERDGGGDQDRRRRRDRPQDPEDPEKP